MKSEREIRQILEVLSYFSVACNETPQNVLRWVLEEELIKPNGTMTGVALKNDFFGGDQQDWERTGRELTMDYDFGECPSGWSWAYQQKAEAAYRLGVSQRNQGKVAA
jgi:hypothetical protein